MELTRELDGRVVLVTGSTDGIGKATALELARRGATVLLHGRNIRKGEAAVADIRRITGSDRLHLYIADFSSQEQVRRLAAQVKEEHDRLHLLINNAGTFEPERKITEDGWETTFSVNYLAPFLLTHELLDLLKASAPSRIINVASIAHWNGAMDWDNLQGEKSYQGFAAYALSKLALILFTYSLAERLQGTGVTANCLHPGVDKNKIAPGGLWRLSWGIAGKGGKNFRLLGQLAGGGRDLRPLFRRMQSSELLAHQLRPKAAGAALAVDKRADWIG